jgi:hypothetical protein
MMSYVQSLLNETELWEGEIIRQYLVEVPPQSHGKDPRFGENKIILELWLSEGAAMYYRSTPYALAESVWLSRVDYGCGCGPFHCYEAGCYGQDCRFPHDVLFYKDAPYIADRCCMEFWQPPAPIILGIRTAADVVAKKIGQTAGEVVRVMEGEHLNAKQAGELIKTRGWA